MAGPGPPPPSPHCRGAVAFQCLGGGGGVLPFLSQRSPIPPSRRRHLRGPGEPEARGAGSGAGGDLARPRGCARAWGAGPGPLHPLQPRPDTWCLRRRARKGLGGHSGPAAAGPGRAGQGSEPQGGGRGPRGPRGLRQVGRAGCGRVLAPVPGTCRLCRCAGSRSHSGAAGARVREEAARGGGSALRGSGGGPRAKPSGCGKEPRRTAAGRRGPPGTGSGTVPFPPAGRPGSQLGCRLPHPPAQFLPRHR